MKSNTLDSLKYPIGHFSCPKEISKEQLHNWILILENFPKKLQDLVVNLNDTQLNTPYRPEGWSVRQLIHHIADSHHHSYTRFKWSLTEDKPVIKAYEEKDWAMLTDATTAPIVLSLNYITALHAKMVYLLKLLSVEQLQLEFIHPADSSKVSVAENIGRYAWHSNHHYGHIENLCKREGWL
ncbi:MAG: YfiT family bacillithiol transferase [Cellulophaga fucicola]